MWILKYWWIFVNSQGQCSDQLYFNAASCQTADSTEPVRTSIEPELKNLKTKKFKGFLKNTKWSLLTRKLGY